MLDKNIIEEYQKNGVVFLKNIIDKEWIKELKIGVEKNFKNPSEYKCVYETNKDQELRQGDRIGMIRFGSRADVYYENYEPLVKVGQKTISGETLLAKK